MPRTLRFHPDGALVEVTTRVVHGRYLLPPTQEAKDLIIGIIGRAQRLYKMELVIAIFFSTHYHMLLRPRDASRGGASGGLAGAGLSRGESTRPVDMVRIFGWRFSGASR